MRETKAQAGLYTCTDSPEHSLHAYTEYGFAAEYVGIGVYYRQLVPI